MMMIITTTKIVIEITKDFLHEKKGAISILYRCIIMHICMNEHILKDVKVR